MKRYIKIEVTNNCETCSFLVEHPNTVIEVICPFRKHWRKAINDLKPVKACREATIKKEQN
jgi:hypothetical protein